MDGDIADLKPGLAKEFCNIEDIYDIGEQIGSGQYAKVVRATSKTTGEEVALKVVKKRKKGITHAVREERDLLVECSHPQVLKLVDVHESELELFLATELLKGGTLWDRLLSGQITTERIASNIFRQLLFALMAIHEKKIIHRDVKPQNVMFVHPDNVTGLRLIDFGTAVKQKKDVDIDKQVGTVKFMAPEMANKKAYTEQVDVWSLGVVLYILLCGCEPFQGQGTNLFYTIREAKVDYSGAPWSVVSPQCKDLLHKLLVKDPSKRLTATEAAKHSWVVRAKDIFCDHYLPDLRLVKEPVIKKFNPRRLLRGAVWCIVAVFNILSGLSAAVQEPQIRLLNSGNNDDTQLGHLPVGTLAGAPSRSLTRLSPGRGSTQGSVGRPGSGSSNMSGMTGVSAGAFLGGNFNTTKFSDTSSDYFNGGGRSAGGGAGQLRRSSDLDSQFSGPEYSAASPSVACRNTFVRSAGSVGLSDDGSHVSHSQQQLPPVSRSGGGPFKSKFCHVCGAKHPNATAKFCTDCGEHRV